MLALLATGCGSSSQSRRPAAGDAGLEQRAEALEERNRQLADQLRQKEQGIEAAFRQATQAESSAGLVNLGCAGVTPAQAPAPGMPRSGSVHAQAGLARRAYRMVPTFSGSRNVGSWRVMTGNCQVVPQ